MSSKSHSDEASASPYNLAAPIRYEELKAHIAKRGPLRLAFEAWPVEVQINITPCPIENCRCDEDVITVVLASGLTSLSTLVTRKKLEEFASINKFATTYLEAPHLLFGSAAEQQYIETQIRNHIGIDVSHLYLNGIPPNGLIQSLSKACEADPWRVQNLHSILQILLTRRQMRDGVGAIDGDQSIREAFPSPNDLALLMDEHYELGFLTARLISEHFTKYAIEPLAMRGLAWDEAQKLRNEGSGQKSTEKRHKRIDSMLRAMERLCEENPMARRISLMALADLAIEDARIIDLALWKQGSGQRDDYLAEMKSDQRYQARFAVIRSKTP